MSPSLSSLCGTLLLSAAGTAIAASSVDLAVHGRITPSACEPSLSNGGIYDLGKIAVNDLNKDLHTALAAHRLQLTVSCDALTLLALEPRDNRLGSSSDSATATKFGLGLINGSKKLGNMNLNLVAILADGVAAWPIAFANPTWAPASLLSHHYITSVTLQKNLLIPVPFKVLSADVLIRPKVAPTSTLTLTEQVPIDGSVTLTMNYL